jgi:NAD(P)-dependent dehydrogenase (short-subunit alcohol dehydrogenase family)
MDDFRDRVAVVTGAGSGIGAALAAGLAGEGALVVAVDIDGDAADTTASRIGVGATAARVDVTDPAAVEHLAHQVFEEHGHVDIVINNAGVFQGGLMWERSLEDYRWSFDVNVFGILHSVRSFVPRMLAADSDGHIVNTASVAAFVAGAGSSPYVVSKCAAFSMTECLALDLKAVGSHIGVSVLTPSAFDTGIAHTARVRPATYGVDGSPDGKLSSEGLAALTQQGQSPDAVIGPVLEGIRRRQFLIATRPSYREQITNRFEALLECRVPGPVVVD